MQEGLAMFWQGWMILRYDRQYGAMGGETPIPFRAYDEYARRYGIEGDDFEVFLACVSAMDAEYLEIVAEQAPKPPPQQQ